jgi:flagellar motility protein MotE (MotC chaperone)
MSIKLSDMTNHGPLTARVLRHRRRLLPYIAVIGCTLVGVVLGGLFDVFPPLQTAHSTMYASQKMPETKAKATKPPAPFFTLPPGQIPLLQSLQDRQTRLESLAERERQLSKREETLGLLQKQIEAKLATLEILRKEIGELLLEKAAFEDQRFVHLVKVYEGMRPEEAASLVERLQEETAVRLFAHMKGRKVSKILEAVKPDVAARLSERLAVLQQQQELAKSQQNKEQKP